MYLTKLDVSGVRNLSSVQIEPGDGINYFYGDNGAGKTSLLEAISLLSVGRSFRSGKISTIIGNNTDEIIVSGLVTDSLRDKSTRVGIMRRNDASTARIDGENISRLSSLATAVPTVSISTSNHELIEGGPGGRRNFLDLILFHVKLTFVHLSKRYKTALSQRNAALRRGASNEMVVLWNKELAETGEAIAEQRRLICIQVQERLKAFAEKLDNAEILPELQYRRGWAEGQSLAENLDNCLDNCRRLGTTSTGPHRADIKLKVDGDEARYLHSRGQQKLLAVLMKLVQVDLYTTHHGQPPILLFDDMPSELDESAREFVFSYLQSTSVQVFLTGVDDISKSIHGVNKTFHVERGDIKNVV